MSHMATPPRPSMPRSSFAIAMKDYTFIRPGIAVTISAATLVAAFVIGVTLIGSLQRASAAVRAGALTSQRLHRYNAGVEVWREMSTSRNPAYRRPEVIAQRDSIGRALRAQLTDLSLSLSLPDTSDRQLVRNVLAALTSAGGEAGTSARAAMIVLLAHQDAALFDAAEAAQRGVVLAAVLLALTVLAAGTLVVPMAWLYVRYKRGVAIEVRVPA